MSARGERFLDPESTARAILGGEPRRDGDDRHISYRAVVPDPGEEEAPTGITDALCQMVVLDQIGHLQVFIGKEIARFHQRTQHALTAKSLRCRLARRRAFCQVLNGSSAILRTLVLVRDAPM